MSTGADCAFIEHAPGEWWYALEDSYHRERYDAYGPFATQEEGVTHLRANHPNPGGWTTYELSQGRHGFTSLINATKAGVQ